MRQSSQVSGESQCPNVRPPGQHDQWHYVDATVSGFLMPLQDQSNWQAEIASRRGLTRSYNEVQDAKVERPHKQASFVDSTALADDSQAQGQQPPHDNIFPSPHLQREPPDASILLTSGLNGKMKDSRSVRVKYEHPPVAIAEPVLCKEQAELVELIASGRNVFYTGSAGCGKSTVLKAFVKRLQKMGRRFRIVTPTGRAALDINGATSWTFAGWTPDSHKKSLADLRKGGRGTKVNKRLNNVDVLVIDEISMVENHHFERLSHLMQEARSSDRAFGGGV